MLLSNLSWPDVKALDFSKLVVVFPTGSFEQHGPHLPLTTDTDLATAVAKGVEQRLADRVLLLPTLWPGHSTHHMHFPGTLSVDQFAYIDLIVNLGKSVASMGAKKCFILNGHGGNEPPLRPAFRELKTQVPQTRFVFASYWALASQVIKQVRESGMGGLNHACEMETSMMLYLHPDRVKMEKAAPDGPSYTDPYRMADMQYGRPIFFVNEFHEVSKSGVVGRPELATADKGKRFLDGIVDSVSTFVEAFAGWENW
jgi:creatinine amidohydrolase